MRIFIIIVLLWAGLSGLIYIVTRNRKSSLSLRQIMFFFGCKIAAGAVYGFLFKRYYNGDDTWKLNNDGLLQYKRLLESPAIFFKEIFTANPIPMAPGFYFQPDDYPEKLEYGILTKLIALSDCISHGNYYINIVFFNFLGFWGLYFLFKLITEQIGNKHQHLVAATIFLFPPALFWLSGLRSEGMLVLFTGILLYQFSHWLTNRKIIIAFACVVSFVLCLIFRNVFACMLIPPLLAWATIVFFKKDNKKTFAAVYTIGILAIATGSFILPQHLNPLAIIASRQHDFFTLIGNTRFNLTPLDANAGSFVKVLPEAFLNTVLRPFPWEANGLLQWFSVLENITILSLAGIAVFKFRSACKALCHQPLVWVLLLAGISNYLLIGYIVPFPGAIVRYKIIPELLLLCAFVMIIARALNDAKENQSITALGQI